MPTNDSPILMTARLPPAVDVALTVFLLDAKSQFFCVKRNQLDTKGTAGWERGAFSACYGRDKHGTGFFYRTVVAVQLGEKIYVLHAFQKKSKKGIATPKQDVELIKQRYAQAKEWAKHEE
jgi:phage-related protein